MSLSISIIIHLLCDPYPPNMSSTLGYVVKDRLTGAVKGISYKHPWDLLFYHDAVNAYATVSHYGKMKSYLIDTIDELPSFTS